MEPTIINIKNEEYYNVDELRSFDKDFFKKIYSSSPRKIIKIYNISATEYNFFCFNNKENKWKESNKNKPSPKAKLFIKKKWCNENINKFKTEKNNDTYDKLPEKLLIEKIDICGYMSDNFDIRGKQIEDEIYFEMSKFEEILEEKNLKSVIQNNKFTENIDYKTFLNKNNKTTFLTYIGLVRLLFVSRNKNATKFQKWAIDILFTHQLGTQEQKKKLSNKLLGIPVKDAKETFKKSSSSISCVYLLSLNTVGKLRKTKTFTIPENIPDDAIVCKYGKSEDLKRRLGEHDNDYGKMKGVELSVLYYSYVDPELITDAENQLKNFFIANNMKLDCEDKNELVIINSDLIKNTKKMYEFISSSCSGSMKEIINKMRYLEQQNEINLLKHQNELKNKDFDCKNKDFELKEKNFEIQKLKTELQHQNEIIKLKEQIYNLKK